MNVYMFLILPHQSMDDRTDRMHYRIFDAKVRLAAASVEIILVVAFLVGDGGEESRVAVSVSSVDICTVKSHVQQS